MLPLFIILQVHACGFFWLFALWPKDLLSAPGIILKDR